MFKQLFNFSQWWFFTIILEISWGGGFIVILFKQLELQLIFVSILSVWLTYLLNIEMEKFQSQIIKSNKLWMPSVDKNSFWVNNFKLHSKNFYFRTFSQPYETTHSEVYSICLKSKSTKWFLNIFSTTIFFRTSLPQIYEYTK